MTHRRQNFMGGAAILALAVAVTKLLGALYKIPLGNLLDREGMAHFYAAYNIYSLLLVLSTAGLPVALSRMVARAAAQRRFGAARRCLRRLTQQGRLTRVGLRYYAAGTVVPPRQQEQKILEYLQREGFAYRQDIARLLGIPPTQCRPILQRLVEAGKVRQEDQRYTLA